MATRKPKPVIEQPSLFDDDALSAPGVPVLGVPGSTKILGKSQKLFNTLIAKIESQRQLLKVWNDYVPAFQRRLAADITPLSLRLRDRRVAMVQLLDQALDHKALGRTHREKVLDLLFSQLQMLLAEFEDGDPVHAQLVAIHDRHADISFAAVREREMAITAEAARGMFGVDLEPDHGAESPEELAQLIGEKLKAQQAAQDADVSAAKPPKKGRKPQKPETAAREAAKQQAREQAEQGATAAIRSVYRQLVSALHPDREPDAKQREHKTALMQQVNQAYEGADLLALLELQLRIEQIDVHALGAMAEERLGHFNHVLQEQLARLQEQLSEITAPFAESLGIGGSRHLTPDAVERALDSDVRNLTHMLSGIDADLRRFADIKVLKASLRHYQPEPHDDDLLEHLMSEMRRRGKPGRRSK